MTRSRMFAAAAAVGLLLASCGGADTVTDTAAAAEQSAFEGVYDTLSGSQIDVGSLEGQDTVLWFWAPW